MKKTAIALSLLLVGCFFCTGCFQIEQSINLDKNLSGTADFHLGIDLEPMIVVMAQMAREMEGKSGPISAADLAKAKAEFKKSSKDTSKEKPPTREEMSKDLPEGVKLLDYKVTEKDFGMASDFKFSFDKLSRLVGVKLASKEGGDPTQKNVIDTPFEGLELIEKGDTITIRTTPVNPSEKVEKEAAAEAPKLDKSTEKLIQDAFKDMRVVYRITAPFTVVSHNATRKEGNTLVWEYDMNRFEDLEKSKKLDDAQVRVTYRR